MLRGEDTTGNAAQGGEAAKQDEILRFAINHAVHKFSVHLASIEFVEVAIRTIN